MSWFPGIGQRVKERLKALGYWKDGRPEVGRFCDDRGYRPQYLYAWFRDRIPSYENLVRLARDLGAPPEWILFGTGPATRPQAPVEPRPGRPGGGGGGGDRFCRPARG